MPGHGFYGKKESVKLQIPGTLRMNKTLVYGLSADIILLIHMLFIVFVVTGFGLIVVGAMLRWSRIKNVTLHRLSCNHFAPYVGEYFEENVTIETEFLERHLFD